MEIKKVIRLQFFLFVALLIFLLSYVLIIYFEYNRWKEESIVNNFKDWWPVLDKYYLDSLTIPNAEKFVTYCKTNTSVVSEFPNMLPVQINMDNIIITSDTLSKIEVWLFTHPINTMDTIYYRDMSFFDFLWKRSILIISIPLPEPCSFQSFIILKDKRKINLDKKVKNKFLKTFFNYSAKSLYNYGDPRIEECCFYAYFKNNKIVFENLTVNTSCGNMDKLATVIVEILQSLDSDITKYEIYFKI